MKKFRELRADEIDCRVATVKDNGISILLYKDARCDMNILDETVQPENWQRSHSRDNANCTVSIWDESKKMWVSKEDTGVESRADGSGNEKKGLASDSFKRACFNWGIGRELYTAPFIWITDCNIKPKGNSFTCYDQFYVSKIGYDENRCINVLQIKNSKSHKVVYELGNTSKDDTDGAYKKPDPVGDKLASSAQKKTIRDICERHHMNVDNRYMTIGTTEEALTEKQAAQILCALKNKFGDE